MISIGGCGGVKFSTKRTRAFPLNSVAFKDAKGNYITTLEAKLAAVHSKWNSYGDDVADTTRAMLISHEENLMEDDVYTLVELAKRMLIIYSEWNEYEANGLPELTRVNILVKNHGCKKSEVLEYLATAWLCWGGKAIPLTA